MAEVELPNPKELHEQSEDRFGRRVALVTAVFAVILSISSLGGNNATKEMLLAQQKSSDQWSFYQAKSFASTSIGRRSSVSRRPHRARPGDVARGAGEARGGGQEWDEEEKRYNAEKKDIEKDAKKLEAVRDLSATRDPYFDLAEVFLQIAIVMSSVSILSRSRPVFYFSLLLAVVGATLTLNGYFILFQLPWLHEGH
jgi:hypothetical protein